MTTYDIIIVGAGINGCALARSLHLKGQKVLVLEQDCIASGGSGAAGAFINPKISKSGPLKELIETAYLYSIDFYAKNFPQYTTSAPLLHIAKYQDDNEKVDYFKQHTTISTQDVPQCLKKMLTAYTQEFSSVYLKDNAVLEAKEICTALIEGIDFYKKKVKKPFYEDGFWKISDFQSKKLVLCTGAYEEIFEEDYIRLRKIHGQRCEIKSTSVMPSTVHHEVSVSATKKNGCIAVGASHYLNKDEMPSLKDGAHELMQLARKSVRLENVELVDTFYGMRAGSNDYLPILGPLIDAKKSLDSDETALKGNKIASVITYPHVYMMNGVGGYGFVLAPYLAELMKGHLLDAQDLPELLDLKRFYYRWAKKKGQK